jgi:osmotically-inducible protein OsmY
MPRKLSFALVLCAAVAVTACSVGPTPAQDSTRNSAANSAQNSAQNSADAMLKARVESALEKASDVSASPIAVAVSDGVVTLTGSVACEACGARRTPAGFASVQQSLGAVVRAVPGVERVAFDLQYQP